MAEQGLKPETIKKVLAEEERPNNYGAALNACKIWSRSEETDSEWHLLDQWSQDERWQYKAAALYGYGQDLAPQKLIEEGLSSERLALRHAALYAARERSYSKEFMFSLCLKFYVDNIGDLPERMTITTDEILEWLDSPSWAKRYLAVRASANRNIPLKKLLNMLGEADDEVRRALVKTLRAKNVPARILRRQWKAHPSEMLLKIMAGRDDMMDIICGAIPVYGWVAAEACQGVHFTLAQVGEWRVSPFMIERLAAAYASIGRPEVQDKWVEEMTRDRSAEVRKVAFKACKGRDFLPRRDFEPPEFVYKKCLHDVIVTAKIPKDAEIRGALDGKARANKALIVGVDGDFYGEKVGVAIFDQATFYHVGDEVFIPDFYLGDGECDTGFHFFTSLEAAKNYRG